MAMLTLTKASEESGLSKTAISRAIRSGRLPADKTDAGAYQIAEGDLESFIEAPEERRRSGGGSEERIMALEQENRSLKKTIGLLKQQVADLQIDRDRWIRQTESAQHMARSGERALRRTSKGLAELRQEALLEAREAARAMAEQASTPPPGEGEAGTPPEAEGDAAAWSMRFGRRSSDAA